MDSFVTDVAYISSDLLTGKSIPALAALCGLPLDPHLAGTMVILGVAGGSLFTYLKAWAPQVDPGWTWVARFLSHAFSVFLSIVVLFRILVDVGDGTRCVVWIPAFCIALQFVPERPGTPLVLGMLTMGAFWAGVLSEEHQTFHQGRPRALLSIPDIHQGRPRALLSTQETTLGQALGSSLWALVLSFYGAVQHGPVFPQSTSRDSRYLSTSFMCRPLYCALIILCGGLLRAYVYLHVAWSSTHPVHRLFEHTPHPPLLQPICAWFYSVVLLFSASWNCTQMTEQALAALPGPRLDARIKATVFILTLAGVLRDPTFLSIRWAAGVASMALCASRLLLVIPMQNARI